MIDRLKTKLYIGNIYTVFVKVRYNIDAFFMAGNQFGFKYTDTSKLGEIYQVVLQKLDKYMEDYDLIQEDVVYIELSFRKKDKILLSDISVDRNITHIEKRVLDTDKKSLNIPVSINQDYLGELLSVEIENNLITNVKVNVNSKEINFMDLINEKSSYIREKHVDNITYFDSSYNFYLTKDEQKKPLNLAIKIIDKQSVDKIRYYLTGIMINRIKDVFCDGYIHKY
jgi:predicted RNA-binding protein